jgi:dTDP-glucose 4,6-dehydratase
MRLAFSDEHTPVNLGNPEERTLNELAAAIIKVTGSSSRIVYESLPIDDPQVRCPDITKAKQLLDWHPTVSLSEGLSRVWEYEVSTESHSMTGLAGDVLEQIVRARPTDEGPAPS